MAVAGSDLLEQQLSPGLLDVPDLKHAETEPISAQRRPSLAADGRDAFSLLPVDRNTFIFDASFFLQDV